METRNATLSVRPTVWLLQGRKAGDNAQLEAVAAALVRLRPCHIKRIPLNFAPGELLITLLLSVSLRGLTPAARVHITPPWPDLILTAGRRNEPVARWIQRASRARTRLVHLGRPWARPDRYDLVVTTPQYFLDPARWRNLLTLPLPPVPGEPGADPHGPLLLLVGGNSGSRYIDTAFIDNTLSACTDLAASRGLPLRLTTSPRTPCQVERRLAARAAREGIEYYAWHASGGADNPYNHWLNEASEIIVTADSISMVAEAAAQYRPLWIAPLPVPARPWWLTRPGWRWQSATHELTQILAPRRFRRNADRLIAELITSGRARWLDEHDSNLPALNTDIPQGPNEALRTATAVALLLPR